MSDPKDGDADGGGECPAESNDKSSEKPTSSDVPSMTDNRTHAVVNRLKSLLSTFKSQHATPSEPTENSKEESSESLPDADQVKMDDTDQDRQAVQSPKPTRKVPLKERSFLNPLLELTAMSQGTTEEAVARQSPDMFENVTIKKEKLDDPPSRSSTPSAKSDVASCPVLSDAVDLGLPATDLGQPRSASLPPTALSCSTAEDTGATTNPIEMPSVSQTPTHAHGLEVSKNETTNVDEHSDENVQSPSKDESVVAVRLGDFVSGIITSKMMPGKNTEDEEKDSTSCNPDITCINTDKSHSSTEADASDTTQITKAESKDSDVEDKGQKEEPSLLSDAENSTLESDALQHLKSKFPLLWEAAHGKTNSTESKESPEDSAKLEISGSETRSNKDSSELREDREHEEVHLEDSPASSSDSNAGGSPSKDSTCSVKVAESSSVGQVSKLSMSDDSDIAMIDELPDLHTAGEPLTADDLLGNNVNDLDDSVEESAQTKPSSQSSFVEEDNKVVEAIVDEVLPDNDQVLDAPLLAEKKVAAKPTMSKNDSVGFTPEVAEKGDERESDILNNSMSDSMMIKIADVKTVNVEDFESAATATENVVPKMVDEANASNVVTILGGDGSDKNIVLQCMLKDDKFNCLSCGFTISFNTSFALHIWKHLHKMSRTCPECFTAGIAKADLNLSPFKITCPVVMSTMDELEKACKGSTRNWRLGQQLVDRLANTGPNRPNDPLAVREVVQILDDESSDDDCVIMAQDDRPKPQTDSSLAIDNSPGILFTALTADNNNPFITLSSQLEEPREGDNEQSGSNSPFISLSSQGEEPPEASQGQTPSMTQSSCYSSPTLVRTSSVSGHQLSEETIVGNIMKLENSKGFFTCGFSKCNFSTSIESNLATHNVVHHSFERAFPCVYCGHTFYNGDSLLVHMKGHHNASKMFQLYCCCFKKCRFCTNNATTFKQHFEIMHPGKDQFSCLFCKEEFMTDDELVQHLNENLLKLTQCPYCHVRSPSRQQVLQHIRRQHPKEGRRVMVTSKTICSDLKKSKTPEKSEMPGKHQCSACNFKTCYVGSLRRHLASCEKAKHFHERMAASSGNKSTESGLKRQESSVSDLSSLSTSDMNLGDNGDEESESFPPIFACSACGFTTSSNSTLLNHIKVIHGIYGSPGKKSSSSQASATQSAPDKSHQEIHGQKQAMTDHSKAQGACSNNDSNDLKCPRCTHYVTKNLSSLKKHMLKHPGKSITKAMACRHCLFLSQTADAVLLHHSENHADLRSGADVDTIKLIFYGEKAACPICSFTCDFKIKSIVNHMMNKHAEDYSALKKALEQLPDEEDEPVDQGRTPEHKIICEYCGLKCTSLGKFLHHVQMHFSGQKQFVFYRCSCCNYHSDHRGLVRAHTKQKHSGVASPPEYIRYVTLTGTQDKQGELSKVSTHYRPVPDGTNVSNRPSTPSDADSSGGNDEQGFYDDHIYQEDNSEERYHEDTRRMEDTQEQFSYPPIKEEPPDEAPPPDPNLLIERFHCDYCGFSTHISDEFAAHECDPHSALEMPRSQPSSLGTSVDNGDESPLSDAGETDDFSSRMCRKLLNDRWQCTECGFVAQHRSKIRRHYRYRHMLEKPFRCGYCTFSAVESAHVKRHCQSLHYGRPLSIINSLKDNDGEFYPEDEDDIEQEDTFNKPSAEVSSQIIRLGPYMFQCKICGYTQETCHLLERHLLCKHFKFHKYKCKYCPSTAAEKGKIIKHCKSAHGGKVGFFTRKFDSGESQPVERESTWSDVEDEPKTMLKEYVPTSMKSPQKGGQKRKSTSKPDVDEPDEEKKPKLEESNDLRSSLLAELKAFYSKIYDTISYEPEMVKIFKCTECHYTSEARGNATRHVNFHHPDSVDFNLITEIQKPTGKKKAATCKLCGHYCQSFTDMKKHVMGVHFKNSAFSCLYCPSRENAKKYMIKHLQNQHPEKPQEILDTPDPNPGFRARIDESYLPQNTDGKYKCMFCPFVRTNKRQVEIHLRNVHFHVANQFRCCYCGFGAGRRDFLRTHHKMLHKNEPFIVMRIGVPGSSSTQSGPSPVSTAQKRKRQDSDSSSFSSTMTMMSPPKKRPMSPPQKMPASPPVKRTRSPALKRLIKSPVVKKESPSFSQSSEKDAASVTPGPSPKLESPSMASSQGPLSRTCSICGKMLHNRLRLVTHIMVHLDYRPHVCPYPACTSRFIEKSYLGKHYVKVHKKSPKYNYVQNDTLDKKLQELLDGTFKPEPKTPETTFVEEANDAKNETKNVSTNSVPGASATPIKVSVEGEVQYKCPHCTYAGNSLTNCFKHMKRHGQRQFKCRHCSFCGFLPSEVKSHWLRCHKKHRKPYAFIKLPSTSTNIKIEPASESSEELSQATAESDYDGKSHAGNIEDTSQTAGLFKSIRSTSKIAHIEGDIGEPIVTTRNKEEGFACPHCDYFSKCSYNCGRHVLRHGPKLIKCKFCDFAGYFPSEMSGHCISKHGKFEFVSLKPEAGKISDSKPSTSTAASTGNQGASTSNQGSQWKKLGSIKPVKCGFSWQFKCPVCRIKMKSRSMVRNHMLVHHQSSQEENDSDKVSCGVSETESGTGESNYTDTDPTHLDKELSTNRPQKCKTVANLLPPRVVKKEGLTTYCCAHCTYESTKICNLNLHVIRHGPKRFCCHYCNYKTFTSKSQYRHQKTRHKDQPMRYDKIDCSTPSPKKESPEDLAKNLLPVVKIKALKVDASGKPILSSKIKKSSAVQKSFSTPLDSVAIPFTRDGAMHYKCKDCTYSGQEARNVKIHYRRTHLVKAEETVDENVQFQCIRTVRRGGTPCGFTTDTLMQIKQHHRRTHREKKLRYKIIQTDVNNDVASTAPEGNAAVDEVKVECGDGETKSREVPPLPKACAVDGKMIYHCEKCPATYPLKSKAAFRNHWESHMYGYECSICGMLTLLRNSVHQHMKRFHKECDQPENFIVDHHPNRLEAEIAQGTSAVDTTSIVDASSVTRDDPLDSSLLKCSHCTYQCTSELDFALHVSLHTPNKTRASSCERRTKSGFWSPRPYECGYCHRGFFAQAKAKAHCQVQHSDQPMNIVKNKDIVNNPFNRSSKNTNTGQSRTRTTSHTSEPEVPVYENNRLHTPPKNSVLPKNNQSSASHVKEENSDVISENELMGEGSDLESGEPLASPEKVCDEEDSEISANIDASVDQKNSGGSCSLGQEGSLCDDPNFSGSEISTDYDSFDEEGTAAGQVSGDLDRLKGGDGDCGDENDIPLLLNGSGDCRDNSVEKVTDSKALDDVGELDGVEVGDEMDCDENIPEDQDEDVADDEGTLVDDGANDGMNSQTDETMEGDVSSEEAWRLELEKNDRGGKLGQEKRESECRNVGDDLSEDASQPGYESLEGDVTDLDMIDGQNENFNQHSAQGKASTCHDKVVPRDCDVAGDADMELEGAEEHAGDESFSSASKQMSFLSTDSQDPSSWMVLDEVSNDGFPADETPA